MTVSVEKFGKDHWSLLAYIENLCVESTDGKARINRNHMRCNDQVHPTLTNALSWLPTYSTRLKGFFDFPDCDNYGKACDAGLQVAGHDDWNCLEDLEAAGIVNIVSFSNGFVSLTEHGLNVAGELRNFRAKGGQCSRFESTESF